MRIQEELGAGSYEDNDSVFFGMKIIKKKNEVPQGISTSTNDSEDKIKLIEISHGRTRTPHEPLKDKELSIFQTEIGKLTRIARMARPDLMYDIFDEARTFSKKDKIGEKSEKQITKEEVEEKGTGGKTDDFSHIPGFLISKRQNPKGLIT